jgi:transcriptional regulator with XRE-family HTH domain
MSRKPAPRAGWTRSSDLLDLTGKLGEKLRGLREMRGLSLGEAADITEVPAPTLSRIEHNKMAPTIGLLSKVVRGYGAPWSSILPDTIVKDRPSGRGASFSSLATQEVKLGRRSLKSLHPNNPLSAQLRTFVLMTQHKTVEDGGGYIAHPDTEFCFVLDGTLTMNFKGKRSRRLRPGESTLFDGNTPHAYTSHTGKPVRFLLVTTRRPRPAA